MRFGEFSRTQSGFQSEPRLWNFNMSDLLLLLLSPSGRGKKANFPVRQKRSHNFQGTVRHVVPTLKVATSRI